MCESHLHISSVSKRKKCHKNSEADENILNPTKYFFRVIDPSCNELANYRRVLDSSWFSDINLTALAVCSDDHLKQFYGSEESDSPKYIDILRHADCHKLSIVFDKTFIIYERRPRTWFKFYDGRCSDRLLEKTETVPLCFLIYYTGTSVNLSLVSSDTFFPIYSPEISETNFIQSNTHIDCHDGDYLHAIHHLLYGGPGAKTTTASTIFDLCDVSSSAVLDYLRLPCLLIVTHVKSVLGRLSNMSSRPEKQRFAVLAVLRQAGSPISNIANSPVIALCNSGFIYVPLPKYASYIKERQTSFREAIDKKKKKESAEKIKCTESDERVSPCFCQLCILGKKYAKNLSIDGPQNLFKAKLDSWEYLTWMNLDSEENREKIHKVCDLSVSSFDLESKTLQLTPNSVDQVPIECVGWYRHLTGLRLLQLPNVFGHLDSKDISRILGDVAEDSENHTEHDSLDEEIKIFRVHQSMSKTINEYIDYLLLRQEGASKLKKEILAPLFLFLERMKNEHMGHFDTHEIEEEYALSAWNATIFGKFEAHLCKLVRNYVCFSFNGSSYDNILLAPAFACALKERGIFFSEFFNKFYKIAKFPAFLVGKN